MLGKKEERIDFLQQKYIEDEIDDTEFEKLCEAALNSEPPYHIDWFLRQSEVGSRQFSTETKWVYLGIEFVQDGNLAVRANE